ncbi:hypothetical protein ACROYT_G032434 [Oculina patagonica]
MSKNRSPRVGKWKILVRCTHKAANFFTNMLRSPPPVQKLKHENGRVKVCSGGRLLILNQTEKFYRDLSNRKQKCKSQKMFHVVIALEKDIPVYKEKLWSGNNYENVGQGSTQHEPYLLFRRFVQVHVQHTTG